jgi:RNA helicase.
LRNSYIRTLRAIAADNDNPQAVVRNAFVFWGVTGTGKSRRAWEEGGVGAYSKDPRTKFWCGYQGETAVIIDEFRGGIDIAHLLRWLDRYPIRVETKGSSRPLCAVTYWITSNLSPAQWYPDADEKTVSAMLRRLTVTEFVSLNKTN